MEAGSDRHVIRKRPGIDYETERRAAVVWDALQARQLRLEGASESIIHNTSQGMYAAAPETLRGVLQQAESLVRSHDVQQAAAQEEKAAQPVVRIVRPFEAKGRSYSISEQRMSREELAGLEDYRQKKEAMAEMRGWDHPEGPGRESLVWPPFDIAKAR